MKYTDSVGTSLFLNVVIIQDIIQDVSGNREKSMQN